MYILGRERKGEESNVSAMCTFIELCIIDGRLYRAQVNDQHSIVSATVCVCIHRGTHAPAALRGPGERGEKYI